MLVLTQVLRITRDAPEPIEEERVSNRPGNGRRFLVAREGICAGDDEIAPHASAAGSAERHAVTQLVVGLPSRLLDESRVVVHLVERERSRLNAGVSAEEAITRPLRFRRLGRRRTPRRRGGRLIVGRQSRGAQEHDAEGGADNEASSGHDRSGGQFTPTAVQACVTARSAALPAPYISRAAWIVAPRAVANVALDGSRNTNAR